MSLVRSKYSVGEHLTGDSPRNAESGDRKIEITYHQVWRSRSRKGGIGEGWCGRKWYIFEEGMVRLSTSRVQ
jgi:hypothetical protein